MLNSEFICVIGTVPSYLGNWGKRVNFGNSVAEIQQKYERKREKMGERKFWISIITLPKFLLAANQLWQCHCRKRGKKNFVAIVAMPLPKMGGKKNKKIMVAEIWGGIKKKMLRPQYFYNIFTTNHRWKLYAHIIS